MRPLRTEEGVTRATAAREVTKSPAPPPASSDPVLAADLRKAKDEATDREPKRRSLREIMRERGRDPSRSR